MTRSTYLIAFMLSYGQSLAFLMEYGAKAVKNFFTATNICTEQIVLLFSLAF